MTFRLYDTMSREIRALEPLDGRTYRFYCCGPTVYGPAHIGNFRTFVMQDTFRRVLECSGTPTRHVRNITDVDDKTIREAQAAGKTLKEFTDDWKHQFHRDCQALNLLEPHVEPAAVDHIPHQIRLIEMLIAKGHAYRADDGSVYFKVASFPRYGRLSRLQEREIRLGAAHSANDSDEYEKEALADFALWKARKPEDGENYWQSPWGEGRPGWHLECSAMSFEYLGESFDMHSGGVDLIFPHHENEIAQSECCSGHRFANHWFHITHLLVDGGKMAKSLGNIYTLSQLAERGHTAEELRYVYLSGSHYRHPLNFTLESLSAAKQALTRLAKFERGLREASGDDETFAYEGLLRETDLGPFQPAFDALLNDLNTPECLGQVFSCLKRVTPKDLAKPEAARRRRQFHVILAALGLRLPALEEDAETIEAPADLRALADARWEAKQSKDWDRADALRQEIQQAGWLVNDGKDGFTLTPQ